MSYITFSTIGEAGNLASQIQQYASLYAIAKETDKQIVFPESSTTRGFGFKFAEVLDIPIVTKPDSFFSNFKQIQANDRLIVDRNMFLLHRDTNYNVLNRFDLFHYWHEKYSKEVSEWKWNKKYLEQATEEYSKIKLQGKETVAIHVRRGDYLLPQHGHFCRLEHNYYEAALQHFFKNIDNYQFIVFSNDIEWCKQNLLEESEIVKFIEPGTDYVDLILMSLCDHTIIANSSYSWWAAYLNRNVNKKVICPTNYLVGSSPWAHINGNYYPPTWTSIYNTN